MKTAFAPIDLIASMPILSLLVGVTMLLLIDLFKLEKRPGFFTFVGVMSCVTSMVFASVFWISGDIVEYAFHGLVAVDRFSALFFFIILGGTLCTLLLNSGQLEGQGVRSSVDVDCLVLLSAAGGLVLASAADLVVMFLGFEVLSVAVYVLAGTARKEKGSAEGAMKYFILGAFSSAFLLYGIALVYGATGTMHIPQIAQALQGAASKDPLFLIGMGLIIFGFAFKVSLVPFHFWAPDAYQGTPVSLTTYMAVVVKASAFAAFLRLLISAFGIMDQTWIGVLSVLCGLSMTVGNIVALRQKSVKRLLAYSSIAHAGYALMGFVVGGSGGYEASVFYIIVYSVMTVASFGVVLIVTAGTEQQYLRDDISSFRGLGWRHPLLGIVMSIAVLSLAGIPPLAGFFGKLYLFKAAVSGGFVWLAILAALNSVVSLYYYLGILVAMYFSDDAGQERVSLKVLSGFSVGVATLAILTLGVFSERFLGYSKDAIESLRMRGAAPVQYLNLGLANQAQYQGKLQEVIDSNKATRVQ